MQISNHNNITKNKANKYNIIKPMNYYLRSTKLIKQTNTDWTTAGPPDISSSSAPKRLKTPFGGAIELVVRIFVFGCAISGLRAGLLSICVLLNTACNRSWYYFSKCVPILTDLFFVVFMCLCFCADADHV